MNNTDDYLINYNKVKIWKIKDAKSKLNEIEGLPLSDCTIKKLIFYNGEPILTGNGVYIFKNDKKYLYVGKCSSNCFVGRIPPHFDIRNTGWFNNFLKKDINNNREIKIKHWYKKKEQLYNKCYIDLLSPQAINSLKKYKVILINFEPNFSNKENTSQKQERIDKIGKLEYILRIVLEPLNKFKTIKKENINTQQKICNFLKK